MNITRYKLAILGIAAVVLVGVYLVLFRGNDINGRPEPLERFFEDNLFSIIYPADSVPAPGAIYQVGEKGRLGNVLAYNDSCAGTLKTKSGKVHFGTRTASSESGLEFLASMSKGPIRLKQEIKGAFSKEVSYTVTSDEMPTLGADWVSLNDVFTSDALSHSCRMVLQEKDAIVLCRVVSARRFKFKFNALKSGGLEIISDVFETGGANVKKESEDTLVLEFGEPMKIAYKCFAAERFIEQETSARTSSYSELPRKMVYAPSGINEFTKELFGIKD